jgi:PhnB protein
MNRESDYRLDCSETGSTHRMRSAYLSLIVGSAELAEQIYALLTDGGQIFMPMQETFFAVRFALRDATFSLHLLKNQPTKGR